MFTGLIEALGRVREVVPGEGPWTGMLRLTVESDPALDGLRPGESVAVDGVCLTVTPLEGAAFRADVIAETLARTTLGGLGPGDRVNLERALRVGDRLGGHWVQGHVDTTVRVAGVSAHGGDRRVRLQSVPEIRRFLAFKGSVALQGVSLTVAAVDAEHFEVALIPETLSRTTLGGLEPGDALNLEVDLLARYLDALGRGETGGGGGG